MRLVQSIIFKHVTGIVDFFSPFFRIWWVLKRGQESRGWDRFDQVTTTWWWWFDWFLIFRKAQSLTDAFDNFLHSWWLFHDFFVLNTIWGFVLWFMINVKVQMLIYWLDGAKSYQLAAISDCLNQVRLGQSDFDLVDYLQLTLKVSYPTEKSPFDIWTLLNSEMNLVVY